MQGEVLGRGQRTSGVRADIDFGTF